MHDRINKGLRCCTPVWRYNHFVSCSAECPYRGEGIFCRSVLFAEVRDYIKQIEEDNEHKQKRIDELETVKDAGTKNGGRFDVPCVDPCEGCNGKYAPESQSPCWGCVDGSNRPNKKG